MKKIIYVFFLLFFVNFTNTIHYNFVKFFSYKKIFNGLGVLSTAAPFYGILIKKIKEHLLINTIKSINVKKVALHKVIDNYNPKIHTVQELDSMKHAYFNLDKQVSDTLQKLQNNAQDENIHNYYKKIQSTEKILNRMYNNTIICLKKSSSNPSVEKHNACLNLWKKDNHFTKEEQ